VVWNDSGCWCWCVWSGWLAGGFNGKQASKQASKLNFLSVSARFAFAGPGKVVVQSARASVKQASKQASKSRREASG
jgi:hypothetical protein